MVAGKNRLSRLSDEETTEMEHSPPRLSPASVVLLIRQYPDNDTTDADNVIKM